MDGECEDCEAKQAEIRRLRKVAINLETEQEEFQTKLKEKNAYIKRLEMELNVMLAKWYVETEDTIANWETMTLKEKWNLWIKLGV